MEGMEGRSKRGRVRLLVRAVCRDPRGNHAHQVLADNVVLACFDLQADVLLGDPRDRRGQGAEIVDVGCVGVDGIGERTGLVRVRVTRKHLLMRRIEERRDLEWQDGGECRIAATRRKSQLEG